MLEKKQLGQCECGDLVIVKNTGKGLLRHLTINKSYFVEDVKDKGVYWIHECNRKRMFKIRNDINKPKWYAVSNYCWFDCFFVKNNIYGQGSSK